MRTEKWSRRQFLRLSAMVTAGAVSAACTAAGPQGVDIAQIVATQPPSTEPVEVTFQHFFHYPHLWE